MSPHRPTRTIICNEFREGRDYSNWRPKGSEDWLLIATISGRGAFVYDDGCHASLNAGDVVLFQPGAYQDYSTDPETGWWHLRWAHFMPKPDWLRWLDWSEVAPKTLWLTLPEFARERCFAALERMVVSFRLPGEDRGSLALNALEEALIHAHATLREDATSRVDSRVQRAMHYLATHVSEPFSMETLARHAGLSVSRLAHLFKDELDQSPQQYAEGMKLDYARRLLTETRLPVNQVAAELGYDDAFYFSRRYQRFHGHAPSRDRTPEGR